MLGHVGLQPGQPHRIGWAIGGEQARAFAHRRLIAVHALAVAGVQRQHQPVKEAPPAAAAFAEQAVHRRGEPHQSQPIAERRRRRRGTVHPYQPAFGRCGSRAGSDLHFAFSRDQMGRHAPAPGAILPRRVRQRRTAQAAPRREQRDGIQNVGLARPIVTGDHHQPRLGIDAGVGVAAKIGEGEAGDRRHSVKSRCRPLSKR